jgi:polar amino acid transport system permease protein
MLLTAAALYWIMSILLELLQVRIERYYGKGFAGEKAGTTQTHIPVPGHH